jgi:predicted transposase/invertase (TIGR01784 family)
LHRWLTFFTQDTDEATLNEIYEMDTTIGKVNQKIEFLMQDEEALREYEMRLMAISDEITARNHAIRMAEKSKKVGLRAGLKKGRQEGREEGRQEERMLIVRSLYQEGFPLVKIAELVHMSVEEVNDILNHSNNE